MIEHNTGQIFTLKFDGRFCDLECESLDIAKDIDSLSDRLKSPKCEAFNWFLHSPIAVDSILKFRRCDKCIERYGMGASK